VEGGVSREGLDHQVKKANRPNKARRRTPTGVEAKVLIDCRRRCALCFGLKADIRQKLDGQLAHADRNRSNNTAENLVWLCMAHHARYDSRSPQAKQPTPSELVHYRQQLVKYLADNNHLLADQVVRPRRRLPRPVSLGVYEKKIVVYRAIRDLIAQVVKKATVDGSDLAAFHHSTDESIFMFDNNIESYVREISSNAIKLRVLHMDADDVVIEALLDDVLDAQLLEESVSEALRLLQGEHPIDRIGEVDRELATVEQERSRLVAAIAAGGQLDGLLQALQARETRRLALESQRAGMRAERRLRASDADRVRNELLTLASPWRRVLADDPTHARPIVSSLLKGRVTITPTDVARKRWTLSGEGSLVGLFERAVFPGMTELLSL
jgi:hypothetical protein